MREEDKKRCEILTTRLLYICISGTTNLNL